MSPLSLILSPIVNNRSIQFKNYVNKLRTKTNGYKKKRSELQDLRAEMGVLARTEEILRNQFEAVKLEIVRFYVRNLAKYER